MSSILRTSSSSSEHKLSASNKYDPKELENRIVELESLLAQSDAVVVHLKKMLTEQGESQSSSIKKLMKERDELRNKNATLVGKLAEVSRKKSLTSPVQPR